MALTEIRAVEGLRCYKRAVMTSGRQVACAFDTCHENITDIIGTLFEKTRYDAPVHSRVRAFFEPVYITNGNGEPDVDYYMDKDGFMLVVTKLTGNGKLESTNLPMLLEYIKAFNVLQEKLVLEYFKEDYLENAPDRRILVSDILRDASKQGADKLEAALVYFSDYIPDRLHEIYRPDKKQKREA